MAVALRHWPGTRAWQIRFMIPACFRRGNRTSPWPAPETVARGLAERWRRLHPQTAPPPPPPGPGPVWVSDLDGRNEIQALTRNLRRDGSRAPQGHAVRRIEIAGALTPLRRASPNNVVAKRAY
jgi:hypothetical protein